MPTPSSNIFHPEKGRERVDLIIVPAVAEILLVCATILWFMVFYHLPIVETTMALLFVLFLGSLICWRSQLAAEAILYVSLFSSEYVLVMYSSVFIIPSIILDLLAVLAMTWIRQPPEE